MRDNYVESNILNASAEGVSAGCSIRVETLGNFEGKSRLPRQNSGTLDKLPREKFWAIHKHLLKDFPTNFNTMENLYT